MARKAEPKPYHHGDLRNALVEAGLKVLAEQGIAGLNLREVARVAGVSHAAPYRHFADKEALVAAIAEDGFRQLQAALRKVVAKTPRTASQQLVAMGQCYVLFALKYSDHFRVMFTSTRDAETQPELYALSKCGFLMLIDAISAGQTSGALVAGDPTDFAKTLWATMHGLAVLLVDQQFPPTTKSPLKEAEAMAGQCVQRVLQGMIRP
jgi:AcrR family transcriptional regulator